jgi:tetratricopeptide (TPR) repeat protein
MHAALRYEDPQRLREYANAHRLARGTVAEFQSGSPVRHVERPRWVKVIDAMNTANRYLARCDVAWLELRALYLEVMSGNAVRSRVRREPWAESILAACRYLGPDHETTARMRRARDAADWYGGRNPEPMIKRAPRIHDGVERHLRTIARPESGRFAYTRASLALERAAARYHTLVPIPFLVLREFRAAASEAEQSAIATVGADLCMELAEVAIALELRRHEYERREALLGTDDDLRAQLLLAHDRCRLGELHLLNGEVATAADLARTTEERLRALTRHSIGQAEHRWWSMALNHCDALLADCLFVQGKRSRAAEHYRKAHEGYAVAGVVDSPSHNERLRATFNAAVFAAGRWQTVT